MVRPELPLALSQKLHAHRWSPTFSTASTPSGHQGVLRALVEGDDFDPVRAPACRVASDRLQRAGLGVDHVGRDRVRLLAGDDYEAAGRVDIETAGLLLGRRASEIGELSARGIDAEGAERARCALRGLETPGVPTAPRGAPGTSLVSGGNADTESSSLSVPAFGSSDSVVTMPVSSLSR